MYIEKEKKRERKKEKVRKGEKYLISIIADKTII